MKDNLEKFVRDNRESFDDKDASKNIWPAIEQRLPGRSVSLWSSLHVWRAAAAVFFGLAIYFYASRPSPRPMHDGAIAQSEFSDMESFYRGEIAQKTEFISRFEGSASPEEMTQNYRNLEAMYVVLGEEMANHPNKKIKDAMILNLLVRIDLLNQTISKLEQAKHKKNSRAAEA